MSQHKSLQESSGDLGIGLQAVSSWSQHHLKWVYMIVDFFVFVFVILLLFVFDKQLIVIPVLPWLEVIQLSRISAVLCFTNSYMIRIEDEYWIGKNIQINRICALFYWRAAFSLNNFWRWNEACWVPTYMIICGHFVNKNYLNAKLTFRSLWC